jgi:hypothetical protein
VKTLAALSPAARRVAGLLRDGLGSAIGDDVDAIWLYGAAVFAAPRLVDLDIHVLLRRPLSPEEVAATRALERAALAAVPEVEDIDAWYVLTEDARRPRRPVDRRQPPGLEFRDTNWALHRAHWLAGACVRLQGLSPAEVVPPPAWPELEAELREAVETARGHLHDGGAYGVLQLCRVLASLATRDVVRSKLDSGDWALSRLPGEAAPAIEAALRSYRGAALPGDDLLIRDAFPAFFALVEARIQAFP